MPPRPNKIACGSKRLSEPREHSNSWKTTLIPHLLHLDYLVMKMQGTLEATSVIREQLSYPSGF